jgi:predicted amidohydrolase
MKVAAYQAPLHATMSMDILPLIREQVTWCESNGVEILCCPEGVLGGLADYSAAVFHKGSILGIYRKLHTAINKSIYVPGNKMPIFTVGDLTFGIVICLDSTYDEPAKVMVSQGASALFIPSNNGLPPAKGGPELVSISRKTDIARAAQNQVSVIRADVAGRNNGFVSFGSSRIVDASGTVLQSAQQLVADLIVAEIVRDRSTIQ